MKVNYLKEWSNSGAVYNQTITITKEMAKNFNNYINTLKNKVSLKSFYSEQDLKDLSLEELKLGKNYTNLIMLDRFMKFYIKEIYIAPKKDRNYERILWRNTIIKVI